MRLIVPSLALSLIPLSAASAQVAPGSAVVPDGAILDVSATGKTVRTPDIATIRAGVVTQGATAAQALADNARRMAAVLGTLRAAGVQPRDIATSNVSLQPQYRYETDKPPVITGYQASNTVSIRFRDIARSGAILDALVAQGANQIDGPSLSLDQPDAALDDARSDAVRRARARAELYARAAGLSVVRILTISESGEPAGPQPPVLYMARAAEPKADTAIVPGETDVTVTVAVRFLLK